MTLDEDFEQTSIRWYEDQLDDQDDPSALVSYEITTSPNDFNVLTLFNFIESGVIVIPGFQRNYVWDLKRASALIESIVIGLPIPQIFLYHESTNRFLVIDGQQRLMSIYYFMKQRFPRDNARIQLRHIFKEYGKIPEVILNDDRYFFNFRLSLPKKAGDRENPLNGLSYLTLSDYQMTFNLRTIRNVIINQNSPDPEEDDSSIYEIFNRLNSGGVNLRPQEIRTSLYHSAFYEMLEHANLLPGWREIIGVDEPDIHMKDLEFILRSFAMLLEGNQYRPSMTKFLNRFSKHCQSLEKDDVRYLSSLFQAFLDSAEHLPKRSFINPKSNRFNISKFDAVFSAVCSDAVTNKTTFVPRIQVEKLEDLANDPEFIRVTQSGTASKEAVETRLGKARHYLVTEVGQ